MAILALEHFNLNPSDLDATVEFYTNVVGFEQGERPAFEIPGVWLYVGKVPAIHVSVRKDDHQGSGSGRVHHVAFRVNAMEDHISRLEERGISYRGQKVPGRPMSQIFFEDPDEITIELNQADGPLPY